MLAVNIRTEFYIKGETPKNIHAKEGYLSVLQ
nr:MAG TPA: hypothetical protein [Caudoviricetes sp.]